MRRYGLRIQNITYAVILLMQNTDPLQKDLQTIHFIHIFLWHSISSINTCGIELNWWPDL